MLTIGASIVSPRVGEVRLADIASQVCTEGPIDVLVLDAVGIRHHVIVEYTAKWAATSWRKELQCHCCLGPARVLQLVNGLCVCRKCLPMPTAHHVHKNAAHWANEGGIADAIVRLTMKPPTSARWHRQRRLAAHLAVNTLASASNVMANAQSLISAVDNLPDQLETNYEHS